MALAADLSTLPASSINAHGLTTHIASRYHQGMPFSTLSTRALVAVNTFAEIDINQEQVFKDLAARVENRMRMRAESQAVLFLGEAGSGKSEFAAALYRNLLVLSGNPLAARLRSVQAVIDGFACAKTSLSLNSTRCGFIRELQYDADSTLIGGCLFDFKLEARRVTKVGTNERNFNVFYHMVNGLSDAERYHLQLSDTAFRYLGHPSQLKLAGMDDRAKFKELKLALYTLGFSRSDVANIFQVLAAILHLGEIQFRPSPADSNTGVVEIVNPDIVELVAQFLGVDTDELVSSLVARTVLIRNDRVTVVSDQRGARENADVLARTLYSLLFSFVMSKINDSLAGEADDPSIRSTISVVDFPGFMPSQNSNLDRLLWNTANELFYNYMLHAYFGDSDDALAAEDVQVRKTEFFDNSDAIKELGRPHSGLLSVIQEYAKNDREDVQLSSSIQRRFAKSQVVTPSSQSFSISHYGGDASYKTTGLLQDAKETLSCDVINLLVGNSSSPFLKEVFQASAVVDDKFDETPVAAHVPSQPRRQLTVRRNDSIRRHGSHRYKVAAEIREMNATIRPKAHNFVLGLDLAISALEEANSYFVLCLKPNDNRLVSSLDARTVRQQVSALGIPELTKRTKVCDLTIFMTFNEYLSYVKAHTDATQLEREQVLAAVQQQGWPDRDLRLGTTGVFLSENAWLQLVDPQVAFADDAARRYAEGSDSFNFDLETKSLAGGFGNMFYTNVPAVADEKAQDIPETSDYTTPQQESPERRHWLWIVCAYTWWVPGILLKTLGKMPFKSVRLAWREKFTINLIIWGICVGSCLVLIAMPYLICPLQNVMSTGQLAEYSSKNDKVYTAIRGIVYDITDFANTHYPSIISNKDILNYGGKDSSDLFPIQISAVCSGVNGTVSPYIVLGDPNNYTDSNAKYHDFRYFTDDSRPDWYLEHMEFFNRNYRKSYIGYTPKEVDSLVEKHQRAVVSLDGYVYDITDYVNGNVHLKSPEGTSIPDNIDSSFMDTDLMQLFENYLGQDVTHKYKKLDMDDQVRSRMNRCLRNVFMIGKLDTQGSTRCLFSRYFLLGITCFVVVIICFKFLAALQFGSYEYPDDMDRFVICQVPAYTEDETALRRAIDSLARTKYDDKRKLLVVICDGMIVGAGNERPTPRIVLDVLGTSPDVDPQAYSFESLGDGDKQHNMAKVYTGLYEVGGHIVPYMVVVKVGKPTEAFRPGNRGKRDSQMLLMRFLNRVHYAAPMSPLELEMYHQIQNVIGINPSHYEYLMQVDADTMVSRESLSQLMGKMIQDQRIQAVCGETELSNARHSITTMIQVYEYFISHNLAKAFESLFGTVTCLPGCFSLYRLYDHRSDRPLLISHPVIEKYSENDVNTLHMKNLLHLGEDRYLTTLLLKYNSQYSTKYLRHAHAYTIAPDSWSVLLSQRRRWINSTVHNLVELVPMSQMCGFCCFSMRFIVLIDLLSTFVQPVTLAYIAYLIYLCISRPGSIPYASIALFAAIYGLQALIFIFRLKWEMIGWMLVYILALPIHSLALPLYSFWHMDDVSWGNTRIVTGESGKHMLVTDEGQFDPAEIPLRRWVDYEAETWAIDNESSITLEEDNSLGEGNSSRQVSSDYTTQMSEAPQFEKYIPTDNEITAAMRKILASGDLTRITRRTVRQELERHFDCSLLDRKDYISWAIESILSGDI